MSSLLVRRYTFSMKQTLSGDYVYKNAPRVTTAKAHAYIDGGTALDVGAGFGNEVRLLLEHGFTVTATEQNDEALAFLAKEFPSITVLKQSLPEVPNELYDLIVCEMVLHFLPKKKAYLSVKAIQGATKSGGIHVLSLHLEQPAIHTDERIPKGYFHYLPTPGEMRQLYTGWKILSYQETILPGSSLAGVYLIARKP